MAVITVEQSSARGTLSPFDNDFNGRYIEWSDMTVWTLQRPLPFWNMSLAPKRWERLDLHRQRMSLKSLGPGRVRKSESSLLSSLLGRTDHLVTISGI